jgi:hypothetical protein
MKRLWLAPAMMIALASIGFPLASVAREKSTDGWVQLFNGKDLTGWKTHSDQPGRWTVEQGELVGSTAGGPISHFYSERGDFADFHLRVEAKINKGGDSGVHFRCTSFLEFDLRPVNAEGKQPLGYEANIAKSTATTGGTGSHWQLGAKNQTFHKPGFDIPIDPDTWFAMEVLVLGNHITTKVNGQTVVDFRDLANSHRKGHLALQAMYAPTRVRFRKIEIKELPPEAPGWVQLFNGKDLSGWKPSKPQSWKVVPRPLGNGQAADGGGLPDLGQPDKGIRVGQRQPARKAGQFGYGFLPAGGAEPKPPQAMSPA